MRKELVFLIAAIVVSVVGEVPSQELGDEKAIEQIRIGIIVPLTGPMAASAQAFQGAAQMALEDVAKKSRLRYKLIFEDDQLQSKNAGTAAKKLIEQDRVSAIISTWSYGGSVVSPIADRAKTLHIGIAWAPQVASGTFNFLNLAPPSSFLPALLEIFRVRSFKTITTIVGSESGSIYSAQELGRLARAVGIRVVSNVEVGYSETDFRSTLVRELKKKPDVLYVNLLGGQLDTFMSQLRGLNPNIPVVIQTGLSTVSSLTPYEGFWFAADTYFPDKALEDRLVRSIGHRHTLYAANFYDSIRILIQAFEQCSSADRPMPTNEEILRCTRSLSTTTSIFPGAAFDKDGVLSYDSRLYTIKGGVSVPTTSEEVVASSWGAPR
jgi:ABC-type branched-subunit amino acid transport system substrate-binding protein